MPEELTPPTSEKIRKFAETLDLYAVAKELLKLKARLDHARDATPANGRSAALWSLLSLVEFVQAIPQLGHKIPPPALTALTAALADLENGKVAPLLEKATATVKGRPVSDQRRRLQGTAAAVMDCLMKSGFSKGEAATIVAKELQKLGIKFGDARNADAGKSISNWRDRARGGTLAEDDTEVYRALCGIFKRFVDPAAGRATNEQRLLGALTESLRNSGDIP